MRVRFIKDPTGKFSLSYEIGEEKDLPESQAMDLIEDGYAIALPTRPETATDKTIKETR